MSIWFGVWQLVAAFKALTSNRTKIPEMKESRFYRFSLWLPIITPALFAPFFLVDAHSAESLQWVVVFITFSGVIGGIPYVALVGLFLWWARGKSDNQFRRALLLLPFLMLPVFDVFVILITFGLWMRGAEAAVLTSDLPMILLSFIPFILGFGYCYVLIVFGTAFVLKRMGILEPLPAI